MFRKRVWRKAASEAVSWHQDEALNATVFILKEFGPTGFLLQEDGEPKNYKVFLGDPHTCTCGTFRKEKDLCKHICWVLMRKFRLPRDHECCFQPGLVEGQMLELLQHPHRTDSLPSGPDQPRCCQEDDGTIRQKGISDGDICPICQEELLRKRLPVVHCRYGCGNSVHISCMKLWADHQGRSETDGMVKCPLCRENFGTFKMLLELVKNAGQLCTSSERQRLEKHLGIPCNDCRTCPVVGKCFRCTVCSYYHLCEDSFKKSCRPQHSFAVKTKRNQSWQPIMESKQSLTANQEMYTEYIETGVMSDMVPEHVLRNFPVIKVHQSSRLLELGIQCRLCLQSFHVGQQVKTLPCRHKFHSGCIKTWLQQSICCPVDWHVIYNPLTWSSNNIKAISATPPKSRTLINPVDLQNAELFVPGVGLQRNKRSDISKAAPLAPVALESIVQDTGALCIDSTHTALPNSCDRRSKQRCLSLEQASVLPCRKSTSGKTSCPSLSFCPVGGAMKGSEKNGKSFTVSFSEQDNKAQRKASSLHGRIRPMRLEGNSADVQTRWGSGDQSSLDLQPTSIPIGAKRERN